MTDAVRIDKWLWAVRLYKTRTLAAAACRSGQVRVDGQPVKASRELRVGNTLTARLGPVTRTVRVRAVLENRVGAAHVVEYLEDLTPPEELEKARAPGLHTPAWRPAGAGRPTKRERRVMDALLYGGDGRLGGSGEEG